MPTVELKITLDEKMQVSVTGPIDQRLVCLGMLELAKDAIHENYRQSVGQIVRPSAADLAFAGKARD